MNSSTKKVLKRTLATSHDHLELDHLVDYEEKTKGGLFITATAQDKPEVAEVIAVGPGGMVDGKEVEMQLKVGDHVIMGKYAGTTVKIDGEEIIILSQNDILAVVED